MGISRRGGLVLAFALLQLAFAASTAHARAYPSSDFLPNNSTSKRVVYYYQTQFHTGDDGGDNGTFATLLPLIAKENLNKQGKPYTTDVLVGAFHLGHESDKTQMHLNDFPPSDKRFDQLWNETKILQSKGINIYMFLGGYTDQSYINLVENFSYYYPILKQTIQTYNFSGIDLDVEDGVETTADIEKVIKQLRSDFGKDFIISLAPVGFDMVGKGGLSAIDYLQLYKDEGSNINWFNVQFYSGFGTLATPDDFEAAVAYGFPANVLVGGMITNSLDGGGFVNLTMVEQTVATLVKKYPDFGGVNGWEYFDSLPGDYPKPAEWATVFGKVMEG